MKKIIAVLLLFSVIFNIFASEASNYKLSDNSELSEKQIVEIESKEEAEPFGYKKNTIRKEVNKKKNELSFSSRIWNSISDHLEMFIHFLRDLLAVIYTTIRTVHNTVFGYSNERYIMTLKNRLHNSSGNIFSYFLSVFLILEIFYFVYKITTGQNFQNTEILTLVYKVFFVFVFWYLLPFLPEAIIYFAFRCAEIITGSEAGSFDWHTGLLGLNNITNISAKTGILLEVSSMLLPKFSFGIGFLEAGLDTSGTFIQIVGIILLASAFTAFFISFKNCLKVMFRGIDFFITNIGMILVLPSAVFTGFGNNSIDIKNLARYYFVNMIELVLGCVILIWHNQIFSVLYANYILPYQNLFLSNGITGRIKYVFLFLGMQIIPPILVSMLLNASSHILSSLLTGSISNNNPDVDSATRAFVSGTGLGAGIATLSHFKFNNSTVLPAGARTIGRGVRSGVNKLKNLFKDDEQL